MGEVAKYRNGKAHENCIDESGKYIVVNSKFVSTNGTVIKHSNMQNEPLAQNEIAFVLSDVPNGRAIARTFLVEENDKYTLNQRIAGITSSENTYPYFLHILMNRHPYFLAFDDGVKQTNLSVSDVLNFETYYPEYEEQKQIGEYFRNLDRLITLHQREFAFLCKEKSKKFRYIKNAWEQRKFSELVQIERGGSPRPIDDFITDAPNGLNWVKIGDAPTQGNYITKTAEKIRPEGLSKTREVHPGDLILSNSMSFGKPYIMGIDGCIHDGWLLIRNTYGVFDLTFLCHLLGTPQMLSQYRSLAAGSTVNNLNKELVGNTYVTIPSITEQRVLGAYLEQLDNLITLHQRKCQINGCRFQSPLAITWEQRKLSEIATMHARIGWQNLRTSEFLDSGDYMLITGTDFIDGAVNFDTCHYVERERYEQDKHIQIRNGSILITKDGTLGKVAYIQGLTMPATLNAGVFNVEIKDENEVDNRYLFQYLKAPFLMDYVDKKATGGTIKHLNQNILVDFPVVLPHKAEQEKIGEYFLAIDHLITLHQCE